MDLAPLVGSPANASTFPCRRMVLRLAAARAAFLSTVSRLVDRCPGPPFGFLFTKAARFIALFNMLGLALLLARITRFISAWHFSLVKNCLFLLNHPARNPSPGVSARLGLQIIGLGMNDNASSNDGTRSIHREV